MPERQSSELVETIGAAGAMAACTLLSLLLRGWYNRWGATPDELKRQLPGDERVTQPRLGYTRAISIRARPADIWPWLVQLGQERGGFYSYERLENLIGCKIHNADRIVPEWQQLEIGDTVRLGPKGYPLYKVVAIQPEKAIVIAGADFVTEQVIPITNPMPDKYVNASWGFYLAPCDDGTTRLILRSRLDFDPPSFANWLIWRILVEPINFVMERKTLLGIKARLEGSLRGAAEPVRQTAAH
jgi:hypothetical protein